MTQGKLTINIEVNERDFIEALLNQKYSGNDNYLFILSIYALGKEWNYSKLTYYLKLLGYEG